METFVVRIWIPGDCGCRAGAGRPARLRAARSERWRRELLERRRAAGLARRPARLAFRPGRDGRTRTNHYGGHEMTRGKSARVVAAAVALLAVGWTTGALASPALTVRITSAPPSTSASASATFGWAANETAEFSCSLDGARAARLQLAEDVLGPGRGLHVFLVTATNKDRAGNTYTARDTHRWTIDLPGRTTTSSAALEHGESPRHRGGRRRSLKRAGGHQLSGRLRAVVPGRDEGDPEPEGRAGIAVCRLARRL